MGCIWRYTNYKNKTKLIWFEFFDFRVYACSWFIVHGSIDLFSRIVGIDVSSLCLGCYVGMTVDFFLLLIQRKLTANIIYSRKVDKSLAFWSLYFIKLGKGNFCLACDSIIHFHFLAKEKGDWRLKRYFQGLGKIWKSCMRNI